jgi:hypothetical protein
MEQKFEKILETNVRARPWLYLPELRNRREHPHEKSHVQCSTRLGKVNGPTPISRPF